MDAIDWEMVAIEARQDGVSPETARAAVEEAEALLSRTRVTVEEITPATRAIIELLRRHLPPTQRG